MNKLYLSLAALTAAATLGLSTTTPASADSAASTRTLILGVAAVAGLAVEANVAHKNAEARNVSGYLADGSTVYGDGHIVDRNGNSYYPGNDGRSVSCNDGRCYVAVDSGVGGTWNGNQNRWNAKQNRRGIDSRRNGDQQRWTNGSDRNDRDDHANR